MSAIDAPPGIAFAGEAAGEFVARPRPRRLAGRVFVFVCIITIVTMFVALRRIFLPLIEVMLAVQLMCVGIAGVGLAVRRARVRVDVDGIRWGWEQAGVRMPPERITVVRAYKDAVAIVPRRGSTWFLCARDWDGFSHVPQALRRAGIPFEQVDAKAPLRARLQSYGLVLDGLLILDVVAAIIALVGVYGL